MGTAMKIIPDDSLRAKADSYEVEAHLRWEGTAFTEEAVGFEEVQRWRSMCDRLLER